MYFFSCLDRETGFTRVIVHLPSLGLARMNASFSDERVRDIMARAGFRLLHVDVIEEARACLGAKYSRGVELRSAPETFDCSGLIVHVFAKKGVRLPRYAIDQLNIGPGSFVVRIDDLKKGDLVFTNGKCGFYWDDPMRRVGHVGLVTGNGTVIHAASSARGVVEDAFKKFFAKRNFVGARRVLPLGIDDQFITVEALPEMDIDSSQTLRWVVLSTVRY